MTNIAMERSTIFKFGKPSINQWAIEKPWRIVNVITRWGLPWWKSLNDELKLTTYPKKSPEGGHSKKHDLYRIFMQKDMACSIPVQYIDMIYTFN